MPPWTKPRARILVADDHALVAEGLSALLGTDYEVVGLAVDGRQLLAQAEALRPDLITLDIGMPLLNGLEAARQVLKIMPRVKLVFITQQVELQYLKAALAAGATGFVAKQSASSEVLVAVRQALAGNVYITPMLEEAYYALSPAQARGGGARETLTPRQREVLQLIAEGHTTKAISEILSISRKTVDFHKDQLMTTLGMRTTAELTRYAVAHGMISTPR